MSRFWPGLFKEVVTFLKSKQVLFSVQETYDLMLCLQDLVRTPGNEGLDFVKDLRILLAQNLARAHLRE